jgi:excisionase family DNA binding protein
MTTMSLSKPFSLITEDEILLTGEDVAKLLNISRTKGFVMIRFGQIPSISLGRCVRVRKQDLLDFVHGNVRHSGE